MSFDPKPCECGNWACVSFISGLVIWCLPCYFRKFRAR